jgi:hypothetical protein
MIYLVRPMDGSDALIYVCSSDSPEKMMDELSSIELEYILSDESVIAKKNDPFLLSLIHEN